MNRKELKHGAKVKHIKSGKLYIVTSCSARMKDSAKGWVDAVNYAPLYESGLKSFTREKESFLSKFEVV